MAKLKRILVIIAHHQLILKSTNMYSGHCYRFYCLNLNQCVVYHILWNINGDDFDCLIVDGDSVRQTFTE